ncbi:MAG: hypothetical protein J6T40_08730 [Clostridiales bacterium]|nr:hypothetical protein [Clostridiales bacterium]
MNEELLFELLSDIDDAYILEAREEFAEDSSAGKDPVDPTSGAPAPIPDTSEDAAAKPSTSKIRRIVIPVFIGIAALAIAFFGGKAIKTTLDRRSGDNGKIVNHSSGETINHDVVSAEDAKIVYTVSVPSDRKVEVNGSFRPAFLRIRLDNIGDIPLLYENYFYLQHQEGEGWVDDFTFGDNTYSEKDRTLAPIDSITRHLEIPYDSIDLPAGKYRLLITIRRDDPSSSDAEKEYVVAAEFDYE